MWSNLLEPMARSASRLYGLLSVLLLAAYAVTMLGASVSTGRAFGALEPWPLGGGVGEAGFAARAAALALGLTLGWGAPGLCLACLTEPRLRGTALLGRALGLGIGYILLTGLGYAALTGHAPGRLALLVLLAIPALLAMRSRAAAADGGGVSGVAVAFAAMVLLAASLWPKLHGEGMNGDGTEAYELARSLESHKAPFWDLERWEGPGKFGTPAVNPFVTNSYLGYTGMAVLGRGELAVRLPLVSALVIGAALAASRLARPGSSGWVYLAGMTVLYALWNAYYVGYEPRFTDLAEPAATDTLMTALWLAGFGEVAVGSAPLGVAFLVLSAGILYSAPLLATAALGALALWSPERGRRAFLLWFSASVVLVPAVLLFGASTGDLTDWVRQVRSEYWYDLVERGRGTPTLPVFGWILLSTGGLPLVALARLRRLSPASRALLATGGAYLGIVLLASHKNLHYLAPLPFLLAPPALEASGPRARACATGVLLGAFALSWPSTRVFHRETVELGRLTCIDGLSYEQAALAADGVYDAFDRPGRGGRFAVGKHTFVRYALDLGGSDCRFRLSPAQREGWIPVAGADVTLFVRDPDLYARWRFLQTPIPSSWLFTRPRPPVLPAEARAWSERLALATEPGRALLVDGFTREDGALARMRTSRARLLVPLRAGTSTVVLETEAPERLALGCRVNGQTCVELPLPAGRGEATLRTDAPPWRSGWNILELQATATAALPGVRSIELRAAPR